MPRFYTIPTALIALWLAAFSLISNPAAAEKRVPFSIFYGGVEIGTYAITAFEEGKQRRLETSMNLRVAFGPITLHRLQQTTREIWEDGKLVRLDAQTAENGGETAVAAHFQAGGLVVEGPNGSTVARGPVGTLPSMILGDTTGQYIDPKNGLLLPVVVESKTSTQSGPHNKFPGQGIRGFSISDGVTADVWRDQSGVVLMVVQSDGVELEFRRPIAKVGHVEALQQREIRVSILSEAKE